MNAACKLAGLIFAAKPEELPIDNLLQEAAYGLYHDLVEIKGMVDELWKAHTNSDKQAAAPA